MIEPFMSGLELAEWFYDEIVEPLLRAELRDAPYSAALIGYGSEVQGFDTLRSTDHAWGPRLQVFLDSDSYRVRAAELDGALDRALPDRFRGYPVRFGFDGAPARHWVHVTDLSAYFAENLGVGSVDELSTVTWLTVPTQVLRELTGGRVFHDGLTALGRYRAALAWYPEDVWRYILACQWRRLADEEPFVGRCGEVGDELGSAVIAARQVRELMRLCLLMDRTYPPYSKWLGTAFAGTEGAKRLHPSLSAVLAAHDWQSRERHLSDAYELVAQLHNERGLTEPLDPHVRRFHDRPFKVLDAHRFTEALIATMTDPSIKSLPRVGAIDQYVDSTALTQHQAARYRRDYITGPARLLTQARSADR